MESRSNQKISEKESPKYRKGTCWFCQNHCNNFGYTHEACIIDYFSKSKSRQLVSA
ncbi:hypothetical protein [Candidatus Nitrosotalea bavarica]|jgi:hypothetical protein|uniref:hypothetical protein n=1 Tax=Candidatus Nitrosotalea bavarica TaxID=1903277 RepID=UPI0013FDB8C6|nr:hypothetical protein [Candidatus Nitrosotalea bavarica]